MDAGCPPSCCHSFAQPRPEVCQRQKLLDEDKGQFRITVTGKTGLTRRKLLYCLLKIEYNSDKQR